MTIEIWILVIVFVLSVVILKKSYDWGMLPWGIISVFALFGFLFFGFLGIIVGLIIGTLLTFLLSFFAYIAMRLFGFGLPKKKNRKTIARAFVKKYHDEIEALREHDKWAWNLAEKTDLFSKTDAESCREASQQKLSDEKLIDAFSEYINEIFYEIRKLKNPARRHKHDLNILDFPENFIEGGRNWVKKPFFASKPPLPGDNAGYTDLKEKFVEFCKDIFYNNPEKVGILKKK